MASKYPAGWLGRLKTSLHYHPSSNLYSLATIEDTVPRVRTVVHRSFVNADTPAPLLVTTTDVRAPKSAHIAGNPHVELAWYIEPTMEQFRISGTAFLVSHEKHAARGSRDLPPDVDWPTMRRETFNTVSGAIRASWCRPIPGSPLQEPAEAWPTSLPPLDTEMDDVTREQTQRAFENFALLVICPMTVDFVELKPVPNLRTKYTIEEGAWKEEPLVP